MLKPGNEYLAGMVIKRRCTQHSRAAGGCAFAHDPDLPVAPDSLHWLPELSPATVLLHLAPAGFVSALSVDPVVEMGVAKVADGRGQTVLIADGSGAIQVQWPDAATTMRPAILLPLDALSELRIDVALRFVRRLRHQRTKLLPARLRLTSLQKNRLIQLLHAFDIHAAGGGPRDVATEVLNSVQAQLPSIEWKDSHARRRANRLIHDSIALVEHGYLKLLRGG